MKSIQSLVVLTSLMGLAGCLSTQNQAPTENPNQASPVVEAYFEYPGPLEKWAGPATWMMHVKVSDQGAPEIKVTPEFARFIPKPVENKAPAAPDNTAPQDGSVAPRVPASSLSLAIQTEPLVPRKLLPSETARDLLNQLASSSNNATPNFSGCMYPVRMRLVRANGGLVEKTGCRSDVGWPRTMSETVSAFLNGAVRPAPVKPVAAEASERTPSSATETPAPAANENEGGGESAE